MTVTLFGRPAATEYAPYYERYIRHVASDDLVGYMGEQIGTLTDVFAPLDARQAMHTYAPGKWTIKEVLGHLIDTERIFQYRAMSIARCDPAPLPSFDQALWTGNASFNAIELPALLRQWTLAREANIAFLDSLDVAARRRVGTAAGQHCSVRALAYIPPGHAAFHLRLLHERYGL